MVKTNFSPLWRRTFVFHALERYRLTSRDFIVGVVIGIEESAPQHVFGRRHFGRRDEALVDLAQIDFVNLLPVGLHRHGWLPVDAVVPTAAAEPATPTAVPAAAASTAPASASSSSAAGDATPAAASTAHLIKQVRSGSSARGLLPTRVDLPQPLSVLAAFAGGVDETLPGHRLGCVDEFEVVVFGLVGLILLLLSALRWIELAIPATRTGLLERVPALVVRPRRRKVRGPTEPIRTAEVAGRRKQSK